MFLFGLTWVFAAFTIEDGSVTFQILFVIFNAFQGFFIFVFFCVFSRDARELWKETLSCGRYKSLVLHPSQATYSNATTQKKTTSNGIESSTLDSKNYSEIHAKTNIYEPSRMKVGGKWELEKTSTFSRTPGTKEETKVEIKDSTLKEPPVKNEEDTNEKVDSSMMTKGGEKVNEKYSSENKNGTVGWEDGTALRATVHRYSTKKEGKHHVEFFEVDFTNEFEDNEGFTQA